MTSFEQPYFKKFNFTPGEINQFLKSAFHDLDIACKDPFPEVRFSYSFQALIKAGIALIAKVGEAKVRSVPGHHVKILSKMSEILGEPEIDTLGNAMRTKRNMDLYSGGRPVSGKEAKDYLEFVEATLTKVEKKIRE